MLAFTGALAPGEYGVQGELARETTVHGFRWLTCERVRYFWTLLCLLDAVSSPEIEAKKIISRIRKQVRVLTKVWTELKQKSKEWQHKLDANLPVSYTCILPRAL